MSRTAEQLRLRNSPLVRVLAQVRISAILKMREFVPAVQEALRHQGYPRFSEQELLEVQLRPESPPKRRELWRFADRANREAVVLAQDFIALETNRYTCFEEFTERLQQVLEIVGSEIEAKATIAERLGLRYVDLILPEDGEPLDDYLEQKLHGLRAKDLGVEKMLNRFEARGQTRFGQLVVRLHQNEEGACLPPDLMPSELTQARTIDPGRLITLLDIDHFTTQSRDYNAPALIDAMWELHEYTERAFRSSVTAHALERWVRE
ncbi:MAG: TIGR04255 family protein [Acidobacteriota bacterium]